MNDSIYRPLGVSLKNVVILPTAVLFSVFVASASAQQTNETNSNRERTNPSYPPEIEGAAVYVYKTFEETELNAYVFSPVDHASSDRRPVIVFFFGGGWKSGSPTQFQEHCKYLASRGMVAITADYRVASRHGVKAVDCVEDAKSAIRWVRQSANKLGIDPNRVVAAGGSAGGHLAACVGVLQGDEDPKVSSRPNALALFNPALVLAPVEGEEVFDQSRRQELRDRMGTTLEKLSPYHLLDDKLPPAIVFHGKADTTVPFRTAEIFCEAAKQRGSQCVLVGYDDAKHGFFNFGRDGGDNYRSTVAKLDEFLVSLGYLNK